MDNHAKYCGKLDVCCSNSNITRRISSQANKNGIYYDDVQIVPVKYNHFDGYVQGPSTLTGYKPGNIVTELNIGGWHDAGAFDLRVESQSGEFYILTLAYKAFDVNYDVTTHLILF